MLVRHFEETGAPHSWVKELMNTGSRPSVASIQAI